MRSVIITFLWNWSFLFLPRLSDAVCVEEKKNKAVSAALILMGSISSHCSNSLFILPFCSVKHHKITAWGKLLVETMWEKLCSSQRSARHGKYSHRDHIWDLDAGTRTWKMIKIWAYHTGDRCYDVYVLCFYLCFSKVHADRVKTINSRLTN